MLTFLPFTILVEVDIDLKLTIPLPPNDVEENEVSNPVSNEENPPPNDGNPLKAEKNEPAPRFLLPRGPLWFPKKSSNGSSKKSNETGSLPPKNSLKTSSGFRNVKPNSKGLSK
uniref:Uncharacterized protein n=1 Tax=Sciurus vulgaris TaxID=55149 RepID=A0A8D2D7R0_SCIVU